MSKRNGFSEAVNNPNGKDEHKTPEVLPGWPGYRTREGRSGLDPIDARTEAAHTFGTLIQALFTGRIRVTNPIVLFLYGAAGLVLMAPFFLAVFETIKGNLFAWDAWILLGLAGIFGLALLIVFIKNLVRINHQAK
jgi:hypothetical protein